MNLFTAVLTMFLLWSAASAHAQEILVDREPKGYAAGVYGNVLVLEPESAEPRALSDSDEIFEGSRFTSSENSFAEIHLADGSEIKIDEMTQVDLARAMADVESLHRQIDLSMLYGSIRAAVQDGYSKQSVFRVTTPVSVTGVRGTDFSVDYESEEESNVDVYEGEVAVSQEGVEESVAGGESSKSVRGQRPAKSRLRENIQERWQQHREAMDLHGQERAESQLREKIEQIRATNPDDPRLAGLENALQNVSTRRDEARTKFETAREKMKERRQARVEKMKEFAKKHGREKFEQARKFRGGKMTEEERKAAAERMRARREEMRGKAAERRDKRKEEMKERKENRKEQMKDRRENRNERRQDKREDRREKIREHRRR